MARGKGKYGPKSKILVVLKSAHHKFLENALSKLIFSKVENGTPYSTSTPLRVWILGDQQNYTICTSFSTM